MGITRSERAIKNAQRDQRELGLFLQAMEQRKYEYEAKLRELESIRDFFTAREKWVREEVKKAGLKNPGDHIFGYFRNIQHRIEINSKGRICIYNREYPWGYNSVNIEIVIRERESRRNTPG